MRRTRTTAVLASAAVLCLSACSVGGVDSPTSAPQITETPTSELTLPPSPPPEEPETSLNAVPSKPMSKEEARQHERDCIMAAASLASIALAPSAFIYGTDQQKLSDLESQLGQMESQVPSALKPHLIKLEAVVRDNFADPANFHADKFRQAAEPIELWLRHNCQG